MPEGSCGVKNPVDDHSLPSGCLVVLMPQPSLLVFSLPLKLCNHSSVDGKKRITLSLCRAELSILHQLPLRPHLEGTSYLIAAHSLTVFLSPTFFFPSVICLFLFLSLSSPSIPLPPLSPFCSFSIFTGSFRSLLFLILSCLGSLSKIKYVPRDSYKEQLFNFQKWGRLYSAVFSVHF